MGLLVALVLIAVAGTVLIAAGLAPTLPFAAFHPVQEAAARAATAPGAKAAARLAATVAPTAGSTQAPESSPGIDPVVASKVSDEAAHFDALGVARFSGTGIIRRGDPATHMVALTFDDGPSASTSAIVDVLNRAKVHATFFFVGGRTVGHENVVREAFADGNEIGDHTWTHTTLLTISPGVFEYQIGQTQRTIANELLGYAPRVLRARAGKADASTVRLAKALGDNMLVVDWTIGGPDTGAFRTPLEIADSVVSRARAGDIILLHETNPRVAAAVPMIVRRLVDEHLKLVTVSEMLAASRQVQYLPYPAALLMTKSRSDPTAP